MWANLTWSSSKTIWWKSLGSTFWTYFAVLRSKIPSLIISFPKLFIKILDSQLNSAHSFFPGLRFIATARYTGPTISSSLCLLLKSSCDIFNTSDLSFNDNISTDTAAVNPAPNSSFPGFIEVINPDTPETLSLHSLRYSVISMGLRDSESASTFSFPGLYLIVKL